MNEENLTLQVGGTLNPRKHIYIQRPEDAQLLNLLERGQFCNVLAPRQMGKSSLMARTVHSLRAAGVRAASVDLAGDLGKPKDPQHWYMDLLGKVERDLGVGLNVEAWWNDQTAKTLNQKLMRFFGEELPSRIDASLVIFLDEIDSALSLPFADDLFLSIRTLNNDRALGPRYEKVSFCLLGVATTGDLIKSGAATTYNVGQTLELQDFVENRDDLSPLSRYLSKDERAGRSLLEKVLHWTGGHPYLTAKLCQDLVEAGVKDAASIDGWVTKALSGREGFRSDIHFEQIARFLDTRASDKAAVLELYGRILRSPEPDKGTPAQTELRLSGLVKRHGDGVLVVRNRIYQRVFDLEWVRRNKPAVLRMPPPSVMNRYVASTIAAILLIVVVVLAFRNFNLSEQIRELTEPQDLSMNSLQVPGAARSTNAAEPILVPGGDKFFVVELEIDEAQVFVSYRAELRDGKGRLIWSRKDLHLSRTGTIPILLGRSFLPAGSYRFRLYGVEADGKEKLVAEYPMTVVYAVSPP